MNDTYHNFKELSCKEIEGEDFTIEIENRSTDFVIVGIHGGQIEPGTEVIVRLLAEEILSYYLFIGNKKIQHITSHNFDEERCLNLITKSKKVISIHGKKGEEEFVMLGGLDTELISKCTKELQKSSFNVLPPSDGVTGTQISNICNKGFSGSGLQIELSKGLRVSLLKSNSKMNTFVNIIKSLTKIN